MNDTSDPNKVIEDPQFLIGKIRQFMRRCEEALDVNQQPDLTGLDEQVRELTESMNHLPVQELKTMKPKLDELMQELNVLGKKLSEQRDAIRNHMQGLNHQQHANSAYAKAQASAPTTASTEEGEQE